MCGVGQMVNTAAPSPTAAIDGPLVTIGIPAYNRPQSLTRAVRSALGQEHRWVEVLISDDASPDPEVSVVIASLVAGDARVRAVRQEHNLGHAANYQWVLDDACGDYFMWLSDDDWIDEGYVARCLAALRADPHLELVCGVARYHRDGVTVTEERPLELRSRRAGRRVLGFFAHVSSNGTLFGVARRDALRSVGFPPTLGGDWLLVGAMAARGQIHSVRDVHIHRSPSGLGADGSSLARSFGYHGLRARRHHAFVAARIWREILGGPHYRPIGGGARLVVATGAAVSILVRFTLADLVRRVLGARAGAALEAWVSRRLVARGRG